MILKLKSILFVVFFIATSTPTIIAAPDYDVIVEEGSTAVINFKNIQAEIAHIKLIDLEGVQLWSDIIRGSTSFRKKFNFKNLPEGTYDIVLNERKKERIQRIRKTEDRIFVIKNLLPTEIKPLSKLVDHNFRISFQQTLARMQSISFQDEKGNMVYRDAINHDGQKFIKNYILKKVPSGVYTAIIKTNMDTYYETIDLR